MTKAEIDALSDEEAYARAADYVREMQGEAAVRRIRVYLPEQVRMFLLANGV